jgi:hypothetical protein
MSDPVWPLSLPEPIITDYSASGTANVLRTPMENGRPRFTRVSKAIMRQVQCSIACNAAQAKTFWQFFDGAAGAGSVWFQMPIDTGNVTANHRCVFMGVPNSKKLRNDAYLFTFSVETDEQKLS